MSSDQLTYVLIALIVTGIAVLLLLGGALAARRGRGAQAAAPPPPEPQSRMSRPIDGPWPPRAASESIHAPASESIHAPAPVTPAGLTPAPALRAAPVEEPAPDLAQAVAQAQVETETPDEAPAVTAEDRAAAARRLQDPREEEIIEGFLSVSPRRREAAFAATPAPTAVGPTAPPAPAGDGSAGPAGSALAADPYLDGATGLDSRLAWERDLAEENARFVRYRRPVGLVVAELDGVARFESQFGADAANRILAAVGGAMRKTARRTDHVAHVGGGRFLVLLPETDEIQAINYVERVRAECERWLAAGAVALHVAMGWASPTAVGELDTALRTAEERMFAERRRASRAGSAGPDAVR